MMPGTRNLGYWAGLPFRRATAGRRQLPDVIIGGAQKSGTTYLAELLAAQPEFFLPAIKEIHFFNAFWGRGPSWYAAHFQLRGSGARQIDASPSYMIFDAVPQRIRELCPDAQLIFVLRDPVARAHSHYQHNVRAGWEQLGFADALAAEDERIAPALAAMERDPSDLGIAYGLYSYRTRGMYARFLSAFHDVFPSEQILVLDSARLFSNDAAELTRLEDYLGCRLDLASQAALERNEGSYPAEPDTTRRELRAVFAPWDEKLVHLTGRRFSWMTSDPGTTPASDQLAL